MLEEVGVPYETVWLDFGPPMTCEEYRTVNPMGKVAALKHGDVVVTEGAGNTVWDARKASHVRSLRQSPVPAPAYQQTRRINEDLLKSRA
jgi:glutathione S-transferase